jgi:hypothetical protein
MKRSPLFLSLLIVPVAVRAQTSTGQIVIAVQRSLPGSIESLSRPN